jgi:hypothetical protein
MEEQGGGVKQSCVKRKCCRPLLPVAAACTVCGLDGWGAQPDHRRQAPDMSSGLYECLLCTAYHTPTVCGRGAEGTGGDIEQAP